MTGRIALTALILALATGASAQTPAAAPAGLPFTLKEIGPGVYAAIDGPQGRSGSNAGFIIGDDGVIVIDSFFDPKAAEALLGEIRRLTPKPIKYVVNTHYHIDHTGGDAVFKAAGATIVAQKNVPGWLHPENIHLFGDRISPERRAQVEALVMPDKLVDKALDLKLGKRKVEIRYWPGHTGGDLIIAVPDAKVVFCGDMVWRRFAPNIIDGTISKWIPTVQALEHRPGAAKTAFVPGHGDMATLKDVADFEHYLADLRTETARAMKAGARGDDLVKAVMAALKPRYGDWGAFERGAPREIGFMAAELSGTKRVPKPVG